MTDALLQAIRPNLETALVAAFELGRKQTETTYDAQLVEFTKTLQTMSAQLTTATSAAKARSSGVPSAVRDDIPIGSYWLTQRAALGTVKPRMLQLISREVGASVAEIEAIGIKPNSISRDTLCPAERRNYSEARRPLVYRYS